MKRCFLGAALLALACSTREPTRLDEKPLPHVRAGDVALIEPTPQSRHLVPLLPERRARLAPRVGGQVTEILVDEEQRVEQGAVLIRLASDDPRGGLMTARASVSRVKESLRDNARELKTARSLAARGAETTRNVERLETERARLQAQLTEMRGSVVRARDRVGAAEILAPFAGTVTSIDTEVGEYVGPGTVALVLAQLDPLAVEVPLTQEQVEAHDGGGLAFKVLARAGVALPDPELDWLASEADPATATFTARLRVPNEGRRLRAGRLVDVEVRGSASVQVKSVLFTAVRWAADRSYVLRIDGETVHRVDIAVLGDSGDRVAIDGPVSIGDRVVVSGPAALISGDPVKVVDAPDETLAGS